MHILYVGNWLRRGRFCSDEFKVARSLELEGHAVRRIHYSDTDALATEPYDLVLWTKIQGGIAPARIEWVRERTQCPQAVWHWDACYGRPAFEWWWQCVPVFDVVFHNELGLFPEYEAKYGTPWRYLDSACDPEYHAPAAKPRDDWRCDVGFIGTAYNEGGRIALMQRLAQKFKVRAWSTSPHLWQKLGVPCDGPVFGVDIAVACASAAIIVGCSYKSWCEGSWSNRIYTVLGSGGFYLTQSVPGLLDRFANRQHLAVYGNTLDCALQCGEWLDSPARRANIAACGAAHVRLHHTWRHRVREMMRHLRELLLIEN